MLAFAVFAINVLPEFHASVNVNNIYIDKTSGDFVKRGLPRSEKLFRGRGVPMLFGRESETLEVDQHARFQEVFG